MIRNPAKLFLLGAIIALGASGPSHAQLRTFGTLVLVESEPIPPGPSPLSAQSAAEWRFVELAYAPLYAPNGSGGYEGVLATAFRVDDGGKAIRATLREGVTWSDGRPITAVDVIYTYELARRGKWNGAFVDTLRSVQKIRRSGDNAEIVFDLSGPVPSPEVILSVPLVPNGLHGDVDDEDRQRPLPLGVIGAGPFKLAAEGDFTKLVANPASPRPPKISEINIVSVGSKSLAIDVVRLHGDAVTLELPRADAVIAASEFGSRRIDATRTRLELIAFDPKASLFADPAVRAAFDLVIDRGELFAAGEGGRPSPAPVGRRSALYPAGLQSQRNLEAARAALAAGGWAVAVGKTSARTNASGSTEELIVQLLVDSDDVDSLRRAAIVRARALEIGMRIDLDPRPRVEFRDRTSSGKFPAALLGLEGASDENLRAMFHTGGGYNVAGFSSPDVDAAFESGDLAAAVKAIAAKIPAIFLGTRVDTGVVGKNVTAPVVTGRGGFGRIDKWQVR
ncbi:MAG: hypothetical protein IV100_06750 [Myxococcales bacterium]|nr:hypothetical protein [Myxococcales bacterium]